VIPLAGSDDGRSVILQAHVDVAPAEQSWPEAFSPKLEGDTLFGRGACDDKGQIVPIYLAFKALQAVALAWTWRGPPTRLTQAFVELAGVQSVEELLEGLTLGRIYLGADAAPVVFQVAAGGDAVAHELILWAGRELGSMAIGVIHQLGFEALSFDVVLAGSFFNGSPLLAETMRQTIRAVASGARLVRLHVPPVVGGVLLGMEQAGLVPSALRVSLIQSAGKLLQTADGGQQPAD